MPRVSGYGSAVADWAEGLGVTGTHVNAETGLDVAVTLSGVKDVLYHNAEPGKLALLEAVPELIRGGVYLETVPRNAHGHVSHIFASKAVVDGAPCLVGFVVTEDHNGRRYYNHELMEAGGKRVEHRGEADRPGKRGHPRRVAVMDIVRRRLGI